jgi:hypothetical protein
MLGAHNQQPVQALGPDGPNKAFCDPVRLWDLNRRLYDSGALGLEHSIETVRKLAIVVANQKTNRVRSVAERPRYARRLLRDPLGVGMGRASGQVDAASGDFDEEQHVQSLKPDGIDSKEINRDHARRLGAQELAPVGPRRFPAGPSCSPRRIFFTVVADTITPRPFSSPTIR